MNGYSVSSNWRQLRVEVTLDNGMVVRQEFSAFAKAADFHRDSAKAAGVTMVRFWDNYGKLAGMWSRLIGHHSI